MPSALHYRLARARAFIWRFHSLQRSRHTFARATEQFILRRRLFGFQMHLDVSRTDAQRLLYLDGARQIAERNLVRGLLAPGMKVVDVGANIGYYLLMIESVIGPAGFVTCFEPEPRNLEELRLNLRANRLSNVEVITSAAGAAEGEIAMRAGINAEVDTSGSGDFRVPVVRLDSVLAGRPVDFLKIDVDGYEGHVLEGARRTLAEHRPTLFLELHPWLIPPPHTAGSILSSLAEHYSSIELWEIEPDTRLRDKIATRYLGRQVRRVVDREALLTERRVWRTAWAVARRPRGAPARH